MSDAERLKILAATGRTVFASRNLRHLWRLKPDTAKIAAKRMVDRGLLHRVARGYFSLLPDFEPLELANLMVAPSYVSLFSALAYHGVSFQARRTVDSVALLNYRRPAAGLEFRYYAMKPALFFNLEGIRVAKGFALAGPERALLDCLYFGLLPDLDVPEKINPERLSSLAEFYPETIRSRAAKAVSPGPR
jgi:predicted transcriptional regulator of viral defense system